MKARARWTAHIQFGSSHTTIDQINIDLFCLLMSIAQQWIGAKDRRCGRHHIQSSRNVTIYLLFELAQAHLFCFSMIISHIWTVFWNSVSHKSRIHWLNNASIAQNGNIELPFVRGFVLFWCTLGMQRKFKFIHSFVFGFSALCISNRLIELMVWSREPPLPIAQKHGNCQMAFLHICFSMHLRARSPLIELFTRRLVKLSN